MGQHVSSVCVITTSHDGKRYGLTATAMSSVCAVPPRLLVCVNKSGRSHEMIAVAGYFCVNVLGEHQDNIAKAFANMMGSDYDRFSLGKWHQLSTGAPVLYGASAVFDCKTVEIIDQFTHSVIIGEVVAVQSTKNQDTLLYGAKRFRTLRKSISETVGDADENLHF
jgi:flavin reductase (DIM6/NTAB) family NADH-FMN oxidoreductase RutF